MYNYLLTFLGGRRLRGDREGNEETP